MKKICIITSTRAEYGLLRWVIQGISESDQLELQLVVTGMHLSAEYGLTVREIEEDGFYIDRKVEMLLSSDTPIGIAKSMGVGIIGFADLLADLKPDLMVVLGDRFELISAVAPAIIARIPIAHLHGGEETVGAVDEKIRHSITKLSELHFVANEEYRARVIQMGERPDRVFNVGGLGVDCITHLQLLGLEELEESMKFKFRSRNLLVTFHPVTQENNTSAQHVDELLNALEDLGETGLIFTMPNADTNNRVIFDKINEFCQKNDNAKVYKSLGQLKYLSCIRYVDAVIGNSSSGITEVPSFRKATINIGDRQKGRLRASSIIDCRIDRDSIKSSIALLYTSEFQNRVSETKNPYGEGGASDAIVKIIEEISLSDLSKKEFYNLHLSGS